MHWRMSGIASIGDVMRLAQGVKPGFHAARLPVMLQEGPPAGERQAIAPQGIVEQAEQRTPQRRCVPPRAEETVITVADQRCWPQTARPHHRLAGRPGLDNPEADVVLLAGGDDQVRGGVEPSADLLGRKQNGALGHAGPGNGGAQTAMVPLRRRDPQADTGHRRHGFQEQPRPGVARGKRGGENQVLVRPAGQRPRRRGRHRLVRQEKRRSLDPFRWPAPLAGRLNQIFRERQQVAAATPMAEPGVVAEDADPCGIGAGVAAQGPPVPEQHHIGLQGLLECG